MMDLSSTSTDRPIAGIATIVAGLFLFSVQDVVIKYFSNRYSVLEIVFVRGMVALTLMLIVLLLTTGTRGLVSNRPGLLCLRGLLGLLSYTTYYLAMAALPLAEVVAIVFTAPIFVTVLSALLLREPVGVRRWMAVVVGFSGTLIIVGPSGHIGNIATLLAILSALSYACSTVITRFVGSHEQPLTISVYSMVMFLVGSGIISIGVSMFADVMVSDHPSLLFFTREWVIPETRDLLLMIFLGINGAVAFYCITKAYCIAPASTISPFEYTYIIWAVVFGYLLWSEVPSINTMLGVVILISSSVYILSREKLARKKRSTEFQTTSESYTQSRRTQQT